MKKEELITLIENLPLCDVEYESEDAISYLAGQRRFKEQILREIEKVSKEKPSWLAGMEDRALQQYLDRIWEHRVKAIVKTVEWKFSEEIPAPVMVRLLKVLRQQDDPTRRNG